MSAANLVNVARHISSREPQDKCFTCTCTTLWLCDMQIITSTQNSRNTDCPVVRSSDAASCHRKFTMQSQPSEPFPDTFADLANAPIVVPGFGSLPSSWAASTATLAASAANSPEPGDEQFRFVTLDDVHPPHVLAAEHIPQPSLSAGSGSHALLSVQSDESEKLHLRRPSAEKTRVAPRVVKQAAIKQERNRHGHVFHTHVTMRHLYRCVGLH